MRLTRSTVAEANVGRCFLPSGVYGAVGSAGAAHGTMRLMCAGNPRLRVQLILRFEPMSLASFPASFNLAHVATSRLVPSYRDFPYRIH